MIIHAEKESGSLEKRDKGKVCQVTVLHLLHKELHTKSGLLVVTGTNMASMGLSGSQRPPTKLALQAGAYWRTAATDSPHAASSEDKLARLLADMTVSVRLS